MGRYPFHRLILVLLLSWILISASAQVYLAITDTTSNTVDLLFDDAYYYLGIAWHLAHDNTSMFASPFITNGYHPLWLLLLTGVTALLDLSKHGLFIACLVLTAAVQCIGLYIFGQGTSDPVRRTAGRIAIFIAILKFPLVFSMGMETTLFIIFIPLLMQAATGALSSRRQCVKLGILMSLVFLTRLDALALDVAVMGIALATRRLPWKHAPAVLMPLVVTLVVYAAINIHFFGTPLPVSGQAKAIGNVLGSNLLTSRAFTDSSTLIIAMIAIWALARLTVARNLRAGGLEICSLAIATAACGLYYGVFSSWPIWKWYLYPCAWLFIYAMIAGILGSAALIAKARSFLSPWPWARIAFLSVAVIVFGMAASAFVSRQRYQDTFVYEYGIKRNLPRTSDIKESSFNRENVDLLPWLEARYPGSATIVMGDRAGGLGYWMPERFKLLHVEGLVADKPFLEVLRSGTLANWLSTQNADLYISDRPGALEIENVFGFVEPVQPRVTNGVLNILCFHRKDVLASTSYLWDEKPQIRQIFDYRQRMECPAAILTKFEELQKTTGGVRTAYGFVR